jgi:hypothetical protein
MVVEGGGGLEKEEQENIEVEELRERRLPDNKGGGDFELNIALLLLTALINGV